MCPSRIAQLDIGLPVSWAHLIGDHNSQSGACQHCTCQDYPHRRAAIPNEKRYIMRSRFASPSDQTHKNPTRACQNSTPHPLPTPDAILILCFAFTPQPERTCALTLNNFPIKGLLPTGIRCPARNECWANMLDAPRLAHNLNSASPDAA